MSRGEGSPAPPPGGDPHEAATLVRDVLPTPGTATPATTPEARSSAASFPVPSWDRYEVTGFLGEGGMGRVFAARDPRLGRSVALKLLKGEDPELARRFLVEARAQARVEHEAVCPVWEVGEVEGHLYIAMPLLRGKTLREAATEMTLEQKVDVVARVAEGLHAAHRIGLVHRDVKPGNVLVETTPDGERRPWVMDFGLVRDASAEGLTVTGTTLGTPWYMPPEQALGRHAAVDRRSDVYSLGVSLYEILAGRLPFDGGTAFDVVHRVLTEEPAPIRQALPGFPADLDTIVLKCLEKDPARRYDSARALADDLRRFLDGEPIAARPAGPLARLARRARKNPALAAMAAGLVVALVSFGAFAFRARLEAARRAEIARSLGEEIRETEVLVRFASYMLPLHDVNRERAVVRHRMRGLEERLPAMGASARAPGAYALGRGHLVLGELDAARERLREAWDLGLRTPDVAWALGTTLAHLYERERRAFVSARTPEERARRRREVDAALRDPALDLLRKAEGARMDSPDYTRALMAELQDDLDTAIALAGKAAEAAPWLYEARTLLGRAYRRRGLEKMETGSDAPALDDLRAAEDAYRRAVDIARSDPAAYTGLCSVFRDLADSAQVRHRPAGAELEQAARWCGDAVAVDPANALSLLRASDVEWQWGIELAAAGKDPRERFARAVALAERSIPSGYDVSYALDNVGIAWVNQAQWEAAHGIDPSASFAKAEGASRRCAREFPNLFSVHCNLAETLMARAREERRRGRDPSPLLAEARGVLETGARLSGHYCMAVNRVQVAEETAQWALLSGADPAPAAREAERRLDELRALNPKAIAGILGAARAVLATAEREVLSGRGAEDAVAKALAVVREAEAESPDAPGVLLLKAEALLLRSRGAPRDAAARAEASAAVARLLQASPSSPQALLAAARALRWRTDGGGTRRDDLEEGLRLSRAALAAAPASAEALLLAGYFAERTGRAAEGRALTARGIAANPLLPPLLGLRAGAAPPPPSRPPTSSPPGGGTAARPSPSPRPGAAPPG